MLTNFDNRQYADLYVDGVKLGTIENIEIHQEKVPKEYQQYNTMKGCSGTFDIKKISLELKLEIMKFMKQQDTKMYKHLRRVYNRQLLTEKLKRKGIYRK